MLWPMRIVLSMFNRSNSSLMTMANDSREVDPGRADERPLPGRSGMRRRLLAARASTWLSHTVPSSANPWSRRIGIPAPMSRQKRVWGAMSIVLSTTGPSFDQGGQVPYQEQDGQSGSQFGDDIAVAGIKGYAAAGGNVV